MRLKNRFISGIWKLLIFACALYGVLVRCGVIGGTLSLWQFRDFGLIISVLICLYFLFASIRAFCGKEETDPQYKGSLTMSSVVIGLVYALLLSRGDAALSAERITAVRILHYIVPVMVFADWLVFDRKGRFRGTDPMNWLIFPDIYCLCAVIYAYTLGAQYPFPSGSRFPYFFLDFDVLGVKAVIYIAALNVAFFLIGFIYYILDRLLKPARKKEKE